MASIGRPIHRRRSEYRRHGKNHHEKNRYRRPPRRSQRGAGKHPRIFRARNRAGSRCGRIRRAPDRRPYPGRLPLLLSRPVHHGQGADLCAHAGAAARRPREMPGKSPGARRTDLHVGGGGGADRRPDRDGDRDQGAGTGGARPDRRDP